MSEAISVAALWLLCTVSVLVSIIYSVRVLRQRQDPLRWLLLGVLASLALTNAPLLYWWETGTVAPLWIGATLRVISAGLLIGTAWSLMCDSWRELAAWFTVARDSWRILSEERRRRQRQMRD